MKQYEIWVTDKSNIPTYIKTYPYKLQCWVWAMMHGYINNGRNMCNRRRTTIYNKSSIGFKTNNRRSFK